MESTFFIQGLLAVVAVMIVLAYHVIASDAA